MSIKDEHPEDQSLQSWNQSVLNIDLDDLEVEGLEQRVELALATIFEVQPIEKDIGCGQFGCVGYMPG